MIEMRDVVKSYAMGKDRTLTVLQRINFKVEKGELVAIMGPSGSGKSTLLNIMGCLDSPTSGSYVLDGKEVARLSSGELAKVRGQKIGFIFQSYNLLSRFSALSNVRLGLRYGGAPDNGDAMKALERVGLGERASHKPTELSGGEQQRVAIARAIAKNPAIILADEPTGNLDSKSSEEIIRILITLHREQGITLVMITHDAHVAHYCQRIIHIMDGTVVGEESPKLVAA